VLIAKCKTKIKYVGLVFCESGSGVGLSDNCDRKTENIWIGKFILFLCCLFNFSTNSYENV
jgi:hypothetical protein